MKKLLLAGVAVIGLAAPAHATTIVFCGPQTEGGTCEGVSEQKVFLEDAKDVTQGFGNVGGQKATPVMSLKSNGGSLNMTIDLANGFGTITPSQGETTFNGIDFTIPGFNFTDLVFDAQLTPSSDPTDHFTADVFSKGVLIASNVFSDAADTDKEFSVVATSGNFDEVSISSATGFDEIKHIEVSGVTGIPEPSTWAMFIVGFGLLGIFGRTKLRQPRHVQL